MQKRRRDQELMRRYCADDVRIFSAAERARFLPDGTGDPRIDRGLAFELLYRLEPGLYDRLVAAERIHPAVLDWLPPADRAVEIGAGTGRLTTHLATRCADVIAVEPARPMRDLLSTALPREVAGKVHITDAFFDRLPVADASADLVVTCSALDIDAAHGGDQGLAEMERACAPGGVMVVVWPNHVDWLSANGFTYLSFPGPTSMTFRSITEAVAMMEIFYPHATGKVKARGEPCVPYDLLGVNPPRDLAFKRKGG